MRGNLCLNGLSQRASTQATRSHTDVWPRGCGGVAAGWCLCGCRVRVVVQRQGMFSVCWASACRPHMSCAQNVFAEGLPAVHAHALTQMSLTRYVLNCAREGRPPSSVTTRQHTLNQVTHQSVASGLLRCGGSMACVWLDGLGGFATARDVQRRMGLGVPHRHWTTRVCHRYGGSTLQYASGSGSGDAHGNQPHTYATPRRTRRGSDTVLIEAPCNMQMAVRWGQHRAITHRRTQHHKGHGKGRHLNY